MLRHWESMNIWPSQPSASAALTHSIVVVLPPARQNSTIRPSLFSAGSMLGARNSRAACSANGRRSALEQVWRPAAFRQRLGLWRELGLGDDRGVTGDRL